MQPHMTHMRATQWTRLTPPKIPYGAACLPYSPCSDGIPFLRRQPRLGPRGPSLSSNSRSGARALGRNSEDKDSPASHNSCCQTTQGNCHYRMGNPSQAPVRFLPVSYPVHNDPKGRIIDLVDHPLVSHAHPPGVVRSDYLPAPGGLGLWARPRTQAITWRKTRAGRAPRSFRAVLSRKTSYIRGVLRQEVLQALQVQRPLPNLF